MASETGAQDQRAIVGSTFRLAMLLNEKDAITQACREKVADFRAQIAQVQRRIDDERSNCGQLELVALQNND